MCRLADDHLRHSLLTLVASSVEQMHVAGAAAARESCRVSVA